MGQANPWVFSLGGLLHAAQRCHYEWQQVPRCGHGPTFNPKGGGQRPHSIATLAEGVSGPGLERSDPITVTGTHGTHRHREPSCHRPWPEPGKDLALLASVYPRSQANVHPGHRTLHTRLSKPKMKQPLPNPPPLPTPGRWGSPGPETQQAEPWPGSHTARGILGLAPSPSWGGHCLSTTVGSGCQQLGMGSPLGTAPYAHPPPATPSPGKDPLGLGLRGTQESLEALLVPQFSSLNPELKGRPGEKGILSAPPPLSEPRAWKAPRPTRRVAHLTISNFLFLARE